MSPNASVSKNKIYGGFNTSQQETYYLKMVDKTFKMIADRLTSVYKNTEFK